MGSPPISRFAALRVGYFKQCFLMKFPRAERSIVVTHNLVRCVYVIISNNDVNQSVSDDKEIIILVDGFCHDVLCGSPECCG